MHWAERLRAMIESGPLTVAPGVFDGLSANLARQAGFAAVYASGGAIARSKGYPDLGLLTMTEMADRVAEIVRGARLPVIADADTGYGAPVNVYRTVEAYVAAGAAALHLEDQGFPKRCGHHDDKRLVPADEMCARLHAARAAADAGGTGVLIAARTDSVAAEGFEAALKRCAAYRVAGADLIFIEALETDEQIARTPARLSCPVMINMFPGGRTPFTPTAELERHGYRLVIVASDLQRAALGAMRAALAEIATGAIGARRLELVGDLADRDAAVDLDDWLARDSHFG